MKYSESAKEVLEKRKGYRNESLYGSGERDLKKVIEYEVKELGNSDIFYTLIDLYPKVKNFIKEKELDEYFISEGEYEKEVDDLVKKTIKWIESEFEKEGLETIWVCSTEEEVITYYSGAIYETDEEDDEELEPIKCSEVKFEGKMMVISDLSEEGVLVVAEKILE